MLSNLLVGFGTCLQPFNLLMILVGTFLGVFAGAMPGISGAIITALLLPVTFFLEPTPALLMLVAIYCGGLFGGSITAILWGIPGASTASATMFDGFPLTQKGQAGKALSVAMLASALGGLLSAFIMILLAPPLASVSLAFGPAEYFSLVVFALAIVGAFVAESPIKGTIMILLGLALTTVGRDGMSGVDRLTFGVPALSSELELIPLMLGLFAISQAVQFMMSKTKRFDLKGVSGTWAKLPSKKEFFELIPTFIRGTLIGTGVGILPAAGGTMAAFMAYGVEKRIHPDVGTGVLRGVAAPESANNASSGGAMVPTVALGIPGSEGTALLLVGLTLHGLQAGPLLFMTQRKLVFSLFAGMLLANVLMVLVGFFLARGFAALLALPLEIVYGVVVALSFVGAYAARNNFLDVWVALVAGIVGVVLKRYKWPVAPLVVGIVLGELLEKSFRQALLVSQNGYATFFTRPISAMFIALTVVVYLLPAITRAIKRRGVVHRQVA